MEFWFEIGFIFFLLVLPNVCFLTTHLFSDRRGAALLPRVQFGVWGFGLIVAIALWFVWGEKVVTYVPLEVMQSRGLLRIEMLLGKGFLSWFIPLSAIMLFISSSKPGLPREILLGVVGIWALFFHNVVVTFLILQGIFLFRDPTQKAMALGPTFLGKIGILVSCVLICTVWTVFSIEPKMVVTLGLWVSLLLISALVIWSWTDEKTYFSSFIYILLFFFLVQDSSRLVLAVLPETHLFLASTLFGLAGLLCVASILSVLAFRTHLLTLTAGSLIVSGALLLRPDLDSLHFLEPTYLLLFFALTSLVMGRAFSSLHLWIIGGGVVLLSLLVQGFAFLPAWRDALERDSKPLLLISLVLAVLFLFGMSLSRLLLTWRDQKIPSAPKNWIIIVTAAIVVCAQAANLMIQVLPLGFFSPEGLQALLLIFVVVASSGSFALFVPVIKRSSLWQKKHGQDLLDRVFDNLNEKSLRVGRAWIPQMGAMIRGLLVIRLKNLWTKAWAWEKKFGTDSLWNESLAVFHSLSDVIRLIHTGEILTYWAVAILILGVMGGIIYFI